MLTVSRKAKKAKNMNKQELKKWLKKNKRAKKIKKTNNIIKNNLKTKKRR